MIYKLPLPPTQNKSLVPTNSGRFVLSAATAAWRKQAAWDIISQKSLSNQSIAINNPCSMRSVFYLPDKRKRDISNLLKQLEDACVDAGILRDDSLIYHHTLIKRFDRYNPRVQFSFRSFNNAM